jgi:hypothetical protein
MCTDECVYALFNNDSYISDLYLFCRKFACFCCIGIEACHLVYLLHYNNLESELCQWSMLQFFSG